MILNIHKTALRRKPLSDGGAPRITVEMGQLCTHVYRSTPPPTPAHSTPVTQYTQKHKRTTHPIPHPLIPTHTCLEWGGESSI
jgi:hypothetical protein